MTEVLGNLDNSLSNFDAILAEFNTKEENLSTIWSAEEAQDFALHVSNLKDALADTRKKCKEYIDFVRETADISRNDVDALVASINSISIGQN